MRRNVNSEGQHCNTCGTAAPSQSRQSDICWRKAANEAGCAESPALKKRQNAPSAGVAFFRRFFLAGRSLLGLLRIVAPRPGRYESNKMSTRGKCMKVYLAALLVGGSVVATSGAVLAHHSFAMFDQEHPIQLVG